VFATTTHFYSGLIFADKAGRSLPLQCNPTRTENIRLRKEVNGSGKHSSLLILGKHYGSKKIIIRAQGNHEPFGYKYTDNVTKLLLLIN